MSFISDLFMGKDKEWASLWQTTRHSNCQNRRNVTHVDPLTFTVWAIMDMTIMKYFSRVGQVTQYTTLFLFGLIYKQSMKTLSWSFMAWIHELKIRLEADRFICKLENIYPRNSECGEKFAKVVVI